MEYQKLIYKLGELIEIYENPLSTLQESGDPTPELDTEMLSKKCENYLIKIGENHPHNLKKSAIQLALNYQSEAEFMRELERHNHGLTGEIANRGIKIPELRASLILALSVSSPREKTLEEKTKEL